MIKYTLKRLLSGVVTVFFIATVTFFAMHAVPGDPLMQNKAVSPEIRKNLEIKYGLDKPLMVQYVTYVKNLVQGDLGISFTQQNRSVNDIITAHFPISAMLGVYALLVAAVGGILWGALAALFRNKLPDRIIMLFVILTVSIPAFMSAAILQLGIVRLNKIMGTEVLPVAGWPVDGSFPLRYMLIPGIVLGLGTMAYLSRLMRSSMLEVVNLDYIRTAKAKGCSPVRTFAAHQLRNAVLPVITVLGPSIAAITTGGFVVELMFAIPGLGRYFIQAIQQLDYTVIMGLTVFYSAFLVFMVVVVDILYGIVDPRIRVQKGAA